MISNSLIRPRVNRPKISDDFLKKTAGSIIIIDEMQRLYSNAGLNTYGFAMACISKIAKQNDIKMMFLSGTMINSSLGEVPDILNIISDNLKQFIIRIGSVIFTMNIIVWLLGSFSFGFNYIPTDGGISMLESIGRFLSPIFVPLGFGNWGATSALIAGLVAKEIIVSSIAIFNGINASETSVNQQIQSSIMNPNSSVFFTQSSVLSYLVFCLLYMPCIATMGVLNREIGIKWTFISILIEFILAYLISFIVYNVYNLCLTYGLGFILILLLGIFIILFSIIFVVKHLKSKDKCKLCGYKCKK